MFEIKITDTCARCGASISGQASFKTDEERREVWRVTKKDYVRYLEPYPAWHHQGFSGNEGAYLTICCDKCGAEYSLKTGPISLYCDVSALEEVDEDLLETEETQREKETTFLAWLKNQRGRGDIVGDFALETFHGEDLPRGCKQAHYRKYPAWPKRATSYSEWIKFLNDSNARNGTFTAFKIAWNEYSYLRRPDDAW